MNRRDPVQRAFDEFGGEAGLEKHSGAWYRESEEAIAVTHLQRSQYGPQYYLNQGYWIRALGEERFPKEWKCHVRVRVTDLLRDETSRLEELLDLEHDIPDEERTMELAELLGQKLVPLIERGSSLVGLREMLENGTLEGAAVIGQAYEILGTGTRT
jgi:hypothetical protein